MENHLDMSEHDDEDNAMLVFGLIQNGNRKRAMPLNENGLAHEYRETLILRADLRSRPAKANKLFKRNHEIYKQLRESAEGRVAISSLMADGSVAVRLTVATHSLFWAREKAEAVLDEISRVSTGEPRFSAGMVLMQFRVGELNLDW